MTEPLSAADRASLAAEQGNINMTIGGVLIFEKGAGLEHPAVLNRFEHALSVAPRLRQRLRSPAPGVANPVWVDDDHFDLGWHIRRASLPQPATERELGELVGHELARKLNRSRPLWELIVIDGLDNNRTAILAKLHHALVDGVAALLLAAAVLDVDQEKHFEGQPLSWQPQSYDRLRHLTQLAATPLTQARKLIQSGASRALLRTPLQTADDLKRASDLALQLAQARPSAPATPLNEPLGPNRRYCTVCSNFQVVRSFAKAHGATVNDVILLIVSKALGKYFATADIKLKQRLVALVPVSVRSNDNQENHGNRIATVFIDLPVEIEDATEQLRYISRLTSEMKQSAAIQAGSLIAGASGIAPPLIGGMIARALGGVRSFNLVVSNVPGPNQPLFLNGCQLLEAYPAVPLNPAQQRLSIGVLSYNNQLCFGLLADRDLTPSLAAMQAALTSELKIIR